jgi:energy-coupling factor transporter ATP-binding protein EcfA2
VRDLQLGEVSPGSIAAQPLPALLAGELRASGYAHVLGYDPINGFRAHLNPGEEAGSGASLMTRLGLQPDATASAPAGLDLFADTLARFAALTEEPAALIVDFASRIAVRNDMLSPPEHRAFAQALVLSHAARPRPRGTPPRPFFNTVVWIADKEGDLPDWLLVGNPRVRHVPVAKPDHRVRRRFAAALLRGLPGFREAPEDKATEALGAFADGTDGMLLVDLAAVAQLARSEGLGFERIGDAVRRFKVGVADDPWARIERDRVRRGADFIRARVKGQDHAVTHVLDIVKRAVTGVGGPRRGGRPRGVAFLAGPTGVGKTEMAKTLTSLLFGDEGAYIRFDMSEFSAEHSDQRLIGAPPGYVGYDVGGELTNAIRERPFSVVLFDEIEKAHPRILDKFLQVLDDGVLTSGRGDRVYFSEAFIVFTSNLGIYRLEPDGTRVANVTQEDPFPEVEAKVKAEIDRHFKVVLNRPELLNRIGDNVLVFDFVRPDVAAAVLDTMIDAMLADVAASHGAALAIEDGCRRQIHELCLADLSNGGRGIRNKVETHLVNPLARALFDAEAGSGAPLRIRSLDRRPDGTTALRLVEAREPDAA